MQISRCRAVVISRRANRQTRTSCPGYKIVQRGSKFNSKINLGEGSSLDQGSKIHVSPSKGIRQEGSQFGGDIQGDKSVKVSQENEINGQKAEAGENDSAES